MSSFLVHIRFAQPEINHVHDVGVLAQAHHYVVRFDVAMNQVALVHVLHSIEQLYEQHQSRLQGEFLPAQLEKIFHSGPE